MGGWTITRFSVIHLPTRFIEHYLKITYNYHQIRSHPRFTVMIWKYVSPHIHSGNVELRISHFSGHLLLLPLQLHWQLLSPQEVCGLMHRVTWLVDVRRPMPAAQPRNGWRYCQSYNDWYEEQQHKLMLGQKSCYDSPFAVRLTDCRIMLYWSWFLFCAELYDQLINMSKCCACVCWFLLIGRQDAKQGQLIKHGQLVDMENLKNSQFLYNNHNREVIKPYE